MFEVKSAIWLVVVAFALTACDEFAGLKVPQPGSACTLGSEIESTLSAPVLKLPIQLYLDPNFTSSQKRDIKSAAEQWNKFSQYSLHKKFFEITGVRPVRNFKDFYSGRDFCGDEVNTGGVYVVSETSVSHWQRIGYSETTAGMTLRCSQGDSARPPQAAVYINTVELREDLFFGVVMHELGHVIGLGHTCSDRPGSYGVSCASLSSSHPYRKAVMTGMNDYRSLSDGTYVRIIGTPMIRT